VVLLDLKMPGLSGFDTLREFKRIDPGLEVIILTGHLLKSTEQEGLALGAFAYLTKPCTVAELVENIESARLARAARCAREPSAP
jgi:DNA-binding response OmpR family regulator